MNHMQINQQKQNLQKKNQKNVVYIKFEKGYPSPISGNDFVDKAHPPPPVQVKTKHFQKCITS